MSVAPAEPQPRFRRPVPSDAVDVARELFDAGGRVDVLAVARRLGVSRATMHRWFGTRDQLLGAVLDGVARDLVDAALADADGRGDERAFDFTRRIAATSAGLGPLRTTAEQEPGLVLQLMLDAEGPVRRHVLEAVRGLLGATRTPAQLRRIDDAIATYVDAAMALHWAALAAGREPDPERYIEIGRALFAAPPPRARRPVSRRARPGSSGTG